MATTMISVNLPENSQDSSQSALELLKPDPPLEQKAEAKIQGNLLNDIDNCSGGTLKGIYDVFGQQFLVEIFDYFNYAYRLQNKIRLSGRNVLR